LVDVVVKLSGDPGALQDEEWKSNPDVKLGQAIGKPRYEIIPIRDDELLLRLDYSLAIQPGIETRHLVLFVRIPTRLARHEHLNVRRFELHDQSGGNVNDFG
jgi:hypothetical protein